MRPGHSPLVNLNAGNLNAGNLNAGNFGFRCTDDGQNASVVTQLLNEAIIQAAYPVEIQADDVRNVGRIGLLKSGALVTTISRRFLGGVAPLKRAFPSLSSCKILLLLLVAAWPTLLAAQASIAPLRTDEAQIVAKYGALPLSFEANQGQTNAEVRFVARGAGYTVLLQSYEADLLLSKQQLSGERPHPLDRPGASAIKAQSATDVLRMRLIGAHAGSALSGESPLPGPVSYFAGDDPAKWHAGIPTFKTVKYAAVYPGTNLVYYGAGRRLEFDFQLAARADANNIKMRFDGAQSLKLDRDGNLIIVASNGHLGFHKPVIYQPDDRGGRSPVDGSFRIASGRTVGFKLGRYDHTRPLIIDPILDYSTYLGPAWEISSIAVDSVGNAYVAGWGATGLPTTSGSFQGSFSNKIYPATPSAFVAKLNSTGTALLYCTYLQGDADDQAYAVAINSAGNAYVAGGTYSSDFPTTPGAFEPSSKSKNSIGFITELNSTGTALVYSTYLGGSTSSAIAGISLDSSGNAYVTGATNDADFPVTAGAFQPASKPDITDEPTGFVAKMNAPGTRLTYSTYLGGSGGDQPRAIATDASGNAYITGGTGSGDFPTTQGAFQVVNNSTSPELGGTGFVTKMNASGTALVYSTFLGGNRLDIAYAIAVDASGSAYVTGYTDSMNFPVTAGVFQPTLHYMGPSGGQNAFVSKLNVSGSELAYSTYLGGSQNGTDGTSSSIGTGIVVDQTGNAYVTGSTADLDFPVTSGALQSANTAQLISADDATFLTKINPSASQILYSTYLSGSGDFSGETCDCADGIAMDGSGNIYLAGETSSEDFPTTAGAFQQIDHFEAGFVTEFSGTEMQSLPLTTTAVTSNVNPQTAQQPVTFTATVQPSSGSTPTGTVAFSALYLSPDFGVLSMSPWSTVMLNGSGSASFTSSNLASGAITVTAYYLGDANNSPSNGSFTENINQIPTTATISSSANSAAYGTPVVFTATVVQTASGAPAQGIVFFSAAGTAYEETTLDSAGQATWTNGTGGPYLPVGADTVTVQFVPTVPSGPYQTSSGSMVETFNALSTTPAPTFQPAPGTYTAAQLVSLNDTVANARIYYTLDGSTPVVGSSTLYLSAIPVSASQTIRAIAIAPGDTASSVVSGAYVFNTPQPDFTFTVTPASVTEGTGQTATTSISISSMNGFAQMVSFTCSGLPSGDTCSFSPATVVSSGSSTLTITLPTKTGANRIPATFPVAPIATLAAIAGWIGFRRRRLPSVLLLFGCTAFLFSLSACGGAGASTGGQQSTTLPSQLVVTIVASAGSLSHSANLTVTTN